jgi:electron transfer flavoprotein alpha subunit
MEGQEPQLVGLVDELIQVEGPPGAESSGEAVTKVLVDIVRENGPAILFLGFTHMGMELAPAVSWRLGVPLITDCVGLDWTGGLAHLRRPIHGGKLLISLAVNLDRGGVISVQKGAWKDEGEPDGDQGTVPLTRLPWRDSWNPEKTKIVGISEPGSEGEDITKAEILVSVGRGLGDVENLPVMKALAEKLGGMISCSRPVVDQGWLPSSRQVGISGKSVTPVIYLALGISGQANHVAGMDASNVIIAVNKDPGAPIFNVAHYGIVDDIQEFVPELLKQIESKKAS